MTKPLYFWNGTTFELVGPTTPQSPFAYQTSAPTAPATGDIWIDSDGDVDTYNRQLTRYYFVASAGQTSVSGTDANGLTLAYVAGSEQVYVNGALQVRGVDYTATNGTSITNLSALALNDVVEVFAYTAFTVANAYTKSETDSVAAAAAGLRMVVPTSVAVGSGTGSANANGFVTFSGCSSVSLNGVFSSTYDNYRIIVNVTSATVQLDPLWLRMRVSGSDNSSTNYKYHFRYFSYGGSGGDATSTTGTGHPLPSVDTGAGNLAVGNKSSVDVIGPFISSNTAFSHLATQYNYGFYGTGIMTVNTSYDSFSLVPAAGNISGTVGVYGYKD